MFITFEGPDGSGKSTILDLVYENLANTYDIVKTREPGGTRISEKLRDIILDKKNTELTFRTEALLYAAARAQHVEEFIVPNLKNGKIVLSDRFVLSSLAYQGVGRELGVEEIENINNFATGKLEPDLVLFFKVDPITTLKRKSILKSADRLELEAEEFHLRVYNGYMEILKKNIDKSNFVEIDANKEIEDVLKDCINTIIKKVEGK